MLRRSMGSGEVPEIYQGQCSFSISIYTILFIKNTNLCQELFVGSVEFSFRPFHRDLMDAEYVMIITLV